jgi:hypothetical protein
MVILELPRSTWRAGAMRRALAPITVMMMMSG